MGIDFKQIFDFEMTPLMATAVFGSLFVVVVFAIFLLVKVLRENRARRSAGKTTAVEENLGDGI